MSESEIYILKHFDTPLVKFSASRESKDADYRVIWIDESRRQLFPFGFEATSEGIESWVKRRNIPKNRAFANTFLARNGLSANRPLGILSLSKGLSLNDCYWVVEDKDNSVFEKVNLYDNRISRLLAQIAFTGYGSSQRTGFLSSPEFTTDGMLPKCWRRIDGKIHLYKGGTTGFANSGFEPYSEYYAADVAKTLGIDSVDYGIHRWKGILCSACELFTSKERSFVSIGDIVKNNGWWAVVSEYELMGEEFREALSDMLAFDALICNTDRHLNNFGVLVESFSNEICAPAPLFDHGNSLFYQAYGDDWRSDNSLSVYAESQKPCLYDDFFDVARSIMTRKTRSKVRKALDFSFTRKPVKGFPKMRLAMIEKQIRTRARLLLE
ncbi:XRE family transcriptional regulator [Adlercreutzia sp. ZJ154]|uniref:XRE family transcriptional regulator n=1 Tax=Adlercreutzia sp. ZJ154 TaxID=2709790 RepID=UPI0013ED374D|nr:XRE family transcriptional regulator [Adlercreutzia sp. ZJ154]